MKPQETGLATRLDRPMLDRRLRVLTMFEQMPRGPGDFAGVFSLDYLDASARVCDVTVLMPGQHVRRGLLRETRIRDQADHLTWTPWLRGGGHIRKRLGRIEALYGLSRLGNRLPEVDLIHAHGPIFHGSAALSLGRKLAVPVVLTVHTGPFSKLLRRASTRVLARRALEGVDCVCPVSEHLRQQIEAAGFHTQRIEVTYNPVNTDLFRLGHPRDHSQRMIFAGRLEEYKGALRVLRAFQDIAERWPNLTLTIAGDGPERPAIEDLLRQHPALATRVTLIGAYTRPQLAELFTASDCFVYPSRHETFGIVLAEAMSAGLPVIGPNCTAPPEFIDARSGLLVPPDDHVALTQAINRLLTELPNYRREVIRSTIVERFGLDVFGERLLTLYTDLCRRMAGDAACAVSPG